MGSLASLKRQGGEQAQNLPEMKGRGKLTTAAVAAGRERSHYQTAVGHRASQGTKHLDSSTLPSPSPRAESKQKPEVGEAQLMRFLEVNLPE